MRQEIKELKRADGVVIRLIKLYYDKGELCKAVKVMPDYECWDSAARVLIKQEGNDGPKYPIVVRPYCPENK
jgi:hypothetical protein